MVNNHMKVIFTIMDYSNHQKLIDFYKKLNLPISFTTHGQGMADSMILDYLGLCDSKKAITFSVLTEEKAQLFLFKLNEHFYLDHPGKGIAFSLPLSSMTKCLSSLVLSNYAQQIANLKGDENHMTHQYSHELIVAIITKGYITEVKKAAVEAGAKGGTLIHGLGIGSEEAEKFLGISIQPEKDVFLIVVQSEKKNQVMSAIASTVGINTQGQGILFSLPVDHVMGLSEIHFEKIVE